MSIPLKAEGLLSAMIRSQCAFATKRSFELLPGKVIKVDKATKEVAIKFLKGDKKAFEMEVNTMRNLMAKRGRPVSYQEAITLTNYVLDNARKQCPNY